MPRFSCCSASSAAVGAAFGFGSTTVVAQVITPITSTTGIANTLTNAVLAPSSGINVVAGSGAYQGNNTTSFQQSATYTGFNLAPSSGSSPTSTLPNGILLTAGDANLPETDTLNNSTSQSGSGDNAGLKAGTATGSGGIPPVPEPEAYALLLAGLRVVGMTARRRGRG